MESSSHKTNVPLVAVTGSMMLGGSSTFLLNLARAFHEKGLVLPIVVVSERNEHAADFAAFPNHVVTISHRGTIYEDRIAKAYQEIARWKPQAVLACLSAESFEPLRLVPSGCRRIGIIQSDDPGPYTMSRRYGPFLDAMVGVSSEISRKLGTFPEFSRCRIETIPYGISFSGDTPVRTLSETEPLRLIYLGRMIEEQKRVSRLVELVNILEQRGENCRFTFAGTGEALSQMQSALAGSRIAEFAGQIPNRGVPAMLAKQDVFVLLSDYEGLPLSLLEAMGQGLVPVVSDLESGIGEVVTDKTGIRVPVGDVIAAADAIASLCRNRERLHGLSSQATRLAREYYSARRMADDFLQLVADLQPQSPAWRERISVPAPIGVPDWMYSGLPRLVRRAVKKGLISFSGVTAVPD